MVFDAGTKIQQTDFNTLPEARQAMNSIRQAIRSFDYHIHKEDSVIYQAVAKVAPYIVAMIDKANVKDLQIGLAIEKRLDEYSNHRGKQNESGFGFELQTSFFAFTSVVLQHINKEEMVINELLWSNYDDCQLIELEASIFNNLLPDEKEWYTDRILKWFTNQEILIWITGILQHGNYNEAEELIQTVKEVLPRERWQMISQNFSMQRA